MALAWTAARWVLHALLALAVLEVCARADDVLTWGAPFWGDYSEEMLFVNDSLGYHLRPHGRFQKWQIDSFGFRGPEITMAKPAGVTRIVAVGASETFGLYESPGKEWPAQLQALLDSVRPGRYQVLNAAIPGISPSRIGRYFEAWLVRFAPDVVIYYPTPSFMLPPPSAPAATAAPRSSAAAAGAPDFSPRIAAKALELYKRLAPAPVQTAVRQWLIDRAVRRHPPAWVLTSVPPERVEAFRAELVALAQLVRAHGAAFVLATHASRIARGENAEERDLLVAWRKLFPNLTASCLMETDSLADALVSGIGEGYRIPVADIARAVPKSSVYFADFEHFTDSGAALAARTVLEQILELGSRPDR